MKQKRHKTYNNLLEMLRKRAVNSLLEAIDGRELYFGEEEGGDMLTTAADYGMSHTHSAITAYKIDSQNIHIENDFDVGTWAVAYMVMEDVLLCLEWIEEGRVHTEKDRD